MRLTILLLAMVFLTGCGHGYKAATVSEKLTLAYRLMDRGQSAQATALLEEILERDSPSRNEENEARLMLASVYAGQAGVDIISLHKAFKDVFFSQSLVDSVEQNNFGQLTSQVPQIEEDDSGLVKLVNDVGQVLYTSQRIMLFLSNLPKVDDQKWPLLEEAISVLQPINNPRDRVAYRFFLRMLYLRELIHSKIKSEEKSALKIFLCNVSLTEIKDFMGQIHKQTSQSEREVEILFSNYKEPLQKVNDRIETGLEAIDILQEKSPTGTLLGLKGLEKLADHLGKCPKD